MTIDSREIDQVFANNPLEAVVFQMSFLLNLRIIRDICEFYELIKEEYPEGEREENVSSDRGNEFRYIFKNSEQEKVLTVTETEFTFEVNQYQSFEDFLKEVLYFIDLFCRLFKIQETTEVRLIYVNNISIPLENEMENLSRYINPHLNLNSLESSSIEGFLTRILKRQGDYGLITSSSLIPQEDSENERIYILELNSFLNQKILVNDICEHLVHLHDNIKQEFLNSVTEEYKQIMGAKI